MSDQSNFDPEEIRTLGDLFKFIKKLKLSPALTILGVWGTTIGIAFGWGTFMTSVTSEKAEFKNTKYQSSIDSFIKESEKKEKSIVTLSDSVKLLRAEVLRYKPKIKLGEFKDGVLIGLGDRFQTPDGILFLKIEYLQKTQNGIIVDLSIEKGEGEVATIAFDGFESKRASFENGPNLIVRLIAYDQMAKKVKISLTEGN